MSKENSVFRSLEIIETRITEKLTVENIADSIYFSKNHYQRRFREIVGDSVMDYVTKRKLTLAGRALLESNATIIDIAMEYGYDSREGFTRSFRAYMGVSPSDYRKYGLAAISQKTVKERKNMTYSVTTDEIIRELNDFIAKAKNTAETVRKNGSLPSLPQPFVAQFWNGIADRTDDYTNNLKAVLQRISAIAEHPDEITNRFRILKTIEELAFTSNIMAFHIGVTVARSLPEHLPILKPLAEKYVELARASSVKAGKIAQFLHELLSLILEDMRKTATEKIQIAVQSGRDAAQTIVGYDYIKHEIVYLVNELSATPIDKITVSLLDNYLYRLFILQFSVDTDVLRSSGRDKAVFDGLTAFRENLREAYDFFSVIITPEDSPNKAAHKHFSDIAFMGNIILFYTRGEVEKMTNSLNENQKTQFRAICDELNSCIQLALVATDDSAYIEIADKLFAIHKDITAVHLGTHGGAVRFIANEIKNLANSVRKCGK